MWGKSRLKGREIVCGVLLGWGWECRCWFIDSRQDDILVSSHECSQGTEPRPAINLSGETSPWNIPELTKQMSTEAAQLTWFTPWGSHKTCDLEKVEVGGLLAASWWQSQDWNLGLLNPKFIFFSQHQSVDTQGIVILILSLPLSVSGPWLCFFSALGFSFLLCKVEFWQGWPLAP